MYMSGHPYAHTICCRAASNKCSYYYSSCQSKQTYLFVCLVNNYAVVSFPDPAFKKEMGMVTLEHSSLGSPHIMPCMSLV